MKVWEQAYKFVPSQHRKISNNTVAKTRMLSEIVRRPQMWAMPVLIIFRGPTVCGEPAPGVENGCIFLPYDLLASASRCSVAIIRLRGNTRLPPIALLDSMETPTKESVAWLAQHFVTAPKVYYHSPEAMVADGWRVS